MVRDPARAERDYLTEPTEYDAGQAKLFDVTCVIGSVYSSPGGNVPPVVAAFAMIAEHDAEGQYRFPGDGPYEYVVTVEKPRTDGER